MSLAAKMFVKSGLFVPCVNLAEDVDLDDIQFVATDLKTARDMVLDGRAPQFFVFVTNSSQLKTLTEELVECWNRKATFWLFYPKKPHLGTDLGRDSTYLIMKQSGMSGTRQVGVDQLWSCLYFKAK